MGRRMRNGIIVMIIALMAGVSLYQLLHLLYDGGDKRDASHLLYQVSLFQMELLNSFLDDAAHATSTGQLNGLKQAVYSAGYAHERLVLAFGEKRLSPLNSVSQLMQFILRLQIGGEREIRPGETETMQQASEMFKRLYEAYGTLVTSGGSIVSSQNEVMQEVDEELTQYIQEKLLE